MAGRCILYVEDEDASAVIAEIVLEELRKPTRLLRVKNVAEAIRFLWKTGEYARAVTPDLVLLDWNLPPDTGSDLLHAMQAVKALREIPIVVFSSLASPMYLREFHSFGVVAHFPKPTTYEGYVHVLCRIVKMAGDSNKK